MALYALVFSNLDNGRHGCRKRDVHKEGTERQAGLGQADSAALAAARCASRDAPSGAPRR